MSSRGRREGRMWLREGVAGDYLTAACHAAALAARGRKTKIRRVNRGRNQGFWVLSQPKAKALAGPFKVAPGRRRTPCLFPVCLVRGALGHRFMSSAARVARVSKRRLESSPVNMDRRGLKMSLGLLSAWERATEPHPGWRQRPGEMLQCAAINTPRPWGADGAGKLARDVEALAFHWILAPKGTRDAVGRTWGETHPGAVRLVGAGQ